MHWTHLVSGAPSLPCHSWAADRIWVRTGLEDELGLKEEASRSALQNMRLWSSSCRNTMGWWHNGEDQGVSHPCKTSWAASSWARNKQEPPCLHRDLLFAHRLYRGIPKSSRICLGSGFFLALQENSLKILLRNDSLESSSGIILQGADATAGCQAALIPGSFPTPTGCRA